VLLRPLLQRAIGCALAFVVTAPALAAEGAPGAAPPQKISTPLDEEDEEDDDATPREDPKARSHRGQLSLRAGILFGYQMAFRYERSPLCTSYDSDKTVEDQQKVCGFGSGAATEIALGFAPLGGIEPYVFGRFGFSKETNTDTAPLKMAGAGARIYTLHDSPLKVFLEPAVAFSFEGSAGNPRWSPPGLNPDYKTDFVFHLGVGPQYDFARYIGVFACGNIDLGILRALTATLNFHFGVQARFP
jgi:hypothetical protein